MATRASKEGKDTSKESLEHKSNVAKKVKEDEQAVADAAKQAVKDTKKGIENLSKKTEEMDIKDIPARLVPSADQVDAKLEKFQDKIEEARHAQVHDKNTENYSKIQQVLKDVNRIVQDEREMLKDKTEDGSIAGAVQSAANLAQEIADESWFNLDTLWSNWTALLTVLATSSAGSWKQLLQESGRLLNDLRYTSEFVQLLNDLKASLFALADFLSSARRNRSKLSKEWHAQRDKLITDLRNLHTKLNASPLWNQLVVRGNAMKAQAQKVGDEAKGQVEESVERIKQSENLKKLKDDLGNVLQLVVGKDGPSVQPFLDYSAAAWDDIMDADLYSQWASELKSLFDTFDQPATQDEEAYQKQLDEAYERTKGILDQTVRNENLRFAMRESKKLVRAAKKDPATRKLIDDSKKLLRDISSKKGTGILDQQLLNELRALIVPVLIHHFDNAPLPDFHGFSKGALGDYDYILSGIRLGTTGLVPSKVKVEFRYKMVANPNKLELEQQHMYMYLYVDDIQVSFKDVKWHYDRHTVPRFSDDGTIDLTTAGKGISLRVKAEVHDFQLPETSHSLSELLSPPKEQKMFEILKADCTIDDFHVRITDTGSNKFYEMLAGIWGTKIKHQIENQIETKLHILATRFDRQLYDIVRRVRQPSLAQEAKTTLQDAGKAISEKATEAVSEAKASLLKE